MASKKKRLALEFVNTPYPKKKLFIYHIDRDYYEAIHINYFTFEILLFMK